MDFFVGQRWISHTEADLGLGIVVEQSGRQLTITFPAAGERRTYAVDNSPLVRVIYKVGDTFQNSEDESFTVLSVIEDGALVEYEAKNSQSEVQIIAELELSSFVQFISPRQRLYSGQLDKPKAYQLRHETLSIQNNLQHTAVQGLIGSRTSLLKHQIYIAAEVAHRHAPRVLLADEVGLGKTIEAGLIIHQQLISGRAHRVLILVPETLIHQWLVEMLRRFNLQFALFDKNRFEALTVVEEEEESITEKKAEEADNPFDTEQLILCSLDFINSNENAQKQAESTEWDLLIIDEAHHLKWSEHESSPEYQCVERLANASNGLLLLTATPEQVGIESHFARLRLLDPDRFYSLEKFKEEETHYRALNEFVQQLINNDNDYDEADNEATDQDQESVQSTAIKLDEQQLASLHSLLGEQAAKDIVKNSHSQSELINHLLDCHGTGRVLFRNTRAAIKGFPGRTVTAYPLPNPDIYQGLVGISQITPEHDLADPSWTEHDPRVSWLQSLLKALRPAKVLVICAKLQTAVQLEEFLRVRCGVHCADFHENLSIIERDRAAAWFAETEAGAQTLICSEIGSEGRNFQFAHHLVLFDLPLNPDLLEQRIGRLDRIGQTQQIQIHAPYLEATAQQVLFRWYHEGINSLEHSCSAGLSIFETFEEKLKAQMLASDDKLEELLSETKIFAEKTRLELQEGRDRLLELNSCRKDRASQLIEMIEASEQSSQLQPFMENIFDQFGVDHDYHSEDAQVLRPNEQMQEPFPSLKEEGMTITFSRELALVREDMHFLSWEHPMVQSSIDRVLNSEFGNVTMNTISVKGIETGTILLETTFIVACIAPKYLQLNRFLAIEPMRVVVDNTGKDLSKILSYDALNSLCDNIPKKLARAVVKQHHSTVEQMIHFSEDHIRPQFDDIIRAAHTRLSNDLNEEIDRLTTLQHINPNVRDEEIASVREQLSSSKSYLEHAQLKLDALRLVINT